MTWDGLAFPPGRSGAGGGGNNTYNVYHATEMRARKLSTDFFSFKDGREIKSKGEHTRSITTIKW